MCPSQRQYETLCAQAPPMAQGMKSLRGQNGAHMAGHDEMHSAHQAWMAVRWVQQENTNHQP